MAATIQVLVSFNGDDAQEPSGLITDADGDLFGTTGLDDAIGGANNDGSVFEIAKTASGYASTPTTLVSFNDTDGINPQGDLVADAAGDLFGTTSELGTDSIGTVFEIAKTSTGYASTPTTLIGFNGTDGSAPVAGLIADTAGDLFGTASGGGANNAGTVFEIVKTASGYASTPATLVSFNGTDGSYPEAGLVADAAGDLFGTTLSGGPNKDGTVFEIAKTSSGYASTPTILIGFNGTDGSAPVAGLIADTAGNLFGTTSSGGANGLGTVFEIAKTSSGYASTPTILVSFNGTDGSSPEAGLIADAAGDSFGTTRAGGANGLGTVFEIAKTANGYASTPTTLVSFNDTDGTEPVTGLIADTAGNLFGTTSFGGADNAGAVFEITDSGFIPTALCFCAGTLIVTPAGEVPVERLAVGDQVVTLSGQRRPIRWIGIGLALATRGRRGTATPVIVSRGALADNVPNRDLRVTKGHALYLDDVLIPVEFLVNHRSIRWDDRAQEVMLYHVELDCHDILLANGAPAESYRDDGNRWLFQNANSGWRLPPKEPYAPVLTGGAIVDAAWRRLLDRAGPRPGTPLTDDPDLHLLLDGLRVDATSRSDALHVFRIDAPPTTMQILSRASAPQELGMARDPRCLGVALSQIVVTHGARIRVIDAKNELLTEGFHDFEADNGIRWTDGAAAVPASLFDGLTGPMELMLHLGGKTSYVDDGTAKRAT